MARPAALEEHYRKEPERPDRGLEERDLTG
jgi:hypothetical protein